MPVICRCAPCNGGNELSSPRRVGVARGPEQGTRPRPLHDPARVHDGYRVGHLDKQRQVVGDEKDGEAEPFPQRDQFLQDLPLGDHVQGGGGLVEDDDARIQGQRHGDHHPLPHAAGQLMRVAGQPVGGDAHHVQQFGRPGPLRVPVHPRPVGPEHVGELRPDGQDRVERVHRALQHHRDVRPAQPAQLLLVGGEQVHGLPRGRVVADLAAGDQAGGPQQPDRRVGQRGLAAAALPGQAEHLAAVQHQVRADHGVHRVLAQPVVHVQAGDLQQRLAGQWAAGRPAAGVARR